MTPHITPTDRLPASDSAVPDLVTRRGIPITHADDHLRRAYDIGAGIYHRARVGRVLLGTAAFLSLAIIAVARSISYMPFTSIDAIFLCVIVIAWFAADWILSNRAKAKMLELVPETSRCDFYSLERQVRALSETVQRPLSRAWNLAYLESVGHDWIRERVARLNSIVESEDPETDDGRITQTEYFDWTYRDMLGGCCRAPIFLKMPPIPEAWREWMLDEDAAD